MAQLCTVMQWFGQGTAPFYRVENCYPSRVRSLYWWKDSRPQRVRLDGLLVSRSHFHRLDYQSSWTSSAYRAARTGLESDLSRTLFAVDLVTTTLRGRLQLIEDCRGRVGPSSCIATVSAFQGHPQRAGLVSVVIGSLAGHVLSSALLCLCIVFYHVRQRSARIERSEVETGA